MKRATNSWLYAADPWEAAKAVEVVRHAGGVYDNQIVEPGARFFVMALELMGATALYSCEGHPAGFYVMFSAPYSTALALDHVGFFDVALANGSVSMCDRWTIRLCPTSDATPSTKARALRLAATAWCTDLLGIPARRTKRKTKS